MAFGLSDTGFEIDTLEEVKDSIEDDLRANLGANISLIPQSVLGQIVGVVSERIHENQIVARDVYTAYTPGGASGDALTAQAMLTGTKRRAASKSRVTATVNLDPGTTLEVGRQANVEDAVTSVFETLEEVTNSGGVAADFPVKMAATVAGPVTANAGTLTEILTPLAGWNSITNADDADIGRSNETDEELRLRREQELRAQGSAALLSILARVRRVDGVISVNGLENNTDSPVTTQGITLPAHSYMVIVWDGLSPAADDDAIAQAIWDAGVLGIQSVYATAANQESGTATDLVGNEHTIQFVRAEALMVDLQYAISVDDDSFPVDGIAQLKPLVAAYLNTLWTVGKDAYPSRAYPTLQAMAGVISTDEALIAGPGDSFGTDPVKPNITQIARIDSTDIEIDLTHVTDGP